ncbi:serine/threonine protein phosphatase [Micromonospora globispora]|uniref:Serine/threonine protein phosphatase n=2 Tax=Micromonospora globispora TaxID=1450148 RepID=A0A317JTM7_9ACTN|nr:protein phosphatase 2C domain-containing protein [Micromonospora globispora]PWU44141.1 serine/threonine protein phosphatase [Micromonospora globispora]
MTAPSCPEHGPAGDPGDRFCEVCGRNLRTGEEATATAAPLPGPRSGTPPVVPWLSSRATEGDCGGCGAKVPGGGYCDSCGRRRSVGRDHAELDLGGLAAVTDRARRPRNEDAVAIGRVAGATVAVVCDGVSTSTRADTAATAAVESAIEELLDALRGGADPAEASRRGARAAAVAARGAAGPADRDTPPSCTYVSAIVAGDAVTVSWIGDSRAYWLGPDEALLTLDDSLRARVAAGLPVPAVLAEEDPRSPALIRWLGADGDQEDAHVVTVRPSGPGRIVVCSDGLHHYLPGAKDLAAAVSGLPPTPLAVAQGLTRLALEGGGHDNVAVAVLPFPVTETGGTPA